MSNDFLKLYPYYSSVSTGRNITSDINFLAGHEGGGGGGGSPNGSDNGMGDYEDDIPAGGSAFGSGGTSAPGLSQGNAATQRGAVSRLRVLRF